MLSTNFCHEPPAQLDYTTRVMIPLSSMDTKMTAITHHSHRELIVLSVTTTVFFFISTFFLYLRLMSSTKLTTRTESSLKTTLASNWELHMESIGSLSERPKSRKCSTHSYESSWPPLENEPFQKRLSAMLLVLQSEIKNQNFKSVPRFDPTSNPN